MKIDRVLLNESNLASLAPLRERCFYHAKTFAMLLAFVLAFQAFAIAQTDAEPQDAVATFNRAQDLHEKGDLNSAIELYRRALKIIPEFPEAEYQCGIAHQSLAKDDEAEAAFRRAISLRPDWSLAYARLGEILVTKYVALGEEASERATATYSEADKVLNKALELDPKNYPAWVALADLRLASSTGYNGLGDTLAKFKQLTEGKSNVPASMWAIRGALEHRRGNYADAKKSLQTALLIDPKNKSALLRSAYVAIDDNDLVRARQFAESLKTSHGNLDALSLLNARILFAEGALVEAEKLLDSIGHPLKGVAEVRTLINAARASNPADLEKQLAADPGNAVVLGRLCSTYRIPAPAKALEFCRRASEAEPANVNHAVGYGAALVQAKQFGAAVNILRKILELAPDNATAHANLATALYELKRYREAKAEYQWLTTKQPNLAVAYFFLGITHDHLGEYAYAIANYQQFLLLAGPAVNKLDIEKVNLRMPALQKKIKK